MTTRILRPANAAEVADMVAWAAAESQALRIAAGDSKRDFGRPVDTAHVLDVSLLSGIVDYEPAELVLTAQSATPMDEIIAALDARGQMLAFEPPDWRGLLHADGKPTLGGTLACNMAGPRRVRAGAARDHFLGFAAVNGRGEVWKAGGKVVKNVTGYDMCKLQAGAFGTLSVLTEVSVKVLPRPETTSSVVLFGLSEVDAIRVLSAALNSPHEVSGAAHLPAAFAGRSTIAGAFPAGQSVTALRLEGPHPSVAYRASALEALHRPCTILEAAESTVFWDEIGAVQPLLARDDTAVWRVCVTPSAAPSLLRAVRENHAGAEGFYDWGGGLLWIEADESSDAGEAAIRGAMAADGGHATLVRGSAELRARVKVFQPLAGPLEALTRRIKAGFDPLGVLNPGRMQQGM